MDYYFETKLSEKTRTETVRLVKELMDDKEGHWKDSMVSYMRKCELIQYSKTDENLSMINDDLNTVR